MSNKVKWMHNGMAGAPVLTNNWGSLTALLDALLVNGFNLKPVLEITRDGDTATARIGSGHGFMVDQYAGRGFQKRYGQCRQHQAAVGCHEAGL